MKNVVNKIKLASAMAMIAALTSLSAAAEETAIQEIMDTQEVQGTNAICYAYDTYGQQYYWTHFNSTIAARTVMDVCFRASGMPCTPGGCSF